jgi:hypothetical protein
LGFGVVGDFAGFGEVFGLVAGPDEEAFFGLAVFGFDLTVDGTGGGTEEPCCY